MLKEGDKAPSFNMPTNKGENVSLSKLKGQKIVFYFYPRDDTPGCTAFDIAVENGHIDIVVLIIENGGY